MKIKRTNIKDIMNKYDWLMSLILLTLLTFILKGKILIFYDEQTSIIDNVISVVGTLLGFILTCLSIFIVFRTDEKYTKDNKENKSTLQNLLSNNNFNNIYVVFLKELYSLGTILLLSFATYFINDIIIELKIFFIIIYMFFICLSITRTALALIAVQKAIKVIIEIK